MKRIEHKEEKWKFSFVEYVPEGAEHAKLPLVLQLHGADKRGDGGEDLALVDIDGFSAYLADQDVPARFIMPQCPKDTFWVAHIESLLAFIEQLKDEFNIDEKRIYLCGISMGGFGTWFLAMAKPELFAAIAPVCGGGMGWNADVLTMPVWAFHGDSDPLVNVMYSDEMVMRLQELDRDVTYSRLKGVGHNAYEYTFGRELIEWFLSISK